MFTGYIGIKRMSLISFAAVAAAASADGALTINSADIVDNKYTYALNPSTFAGQFANDATDRFNLDPSEGWGDVFVRRADSGLTGIASFTYKFDFSSLGYTIAGINTRELLNTYTNDGIGGITVKYSTDGTDFTTKYALAASTSGYNFVDTTWQAPDSHWFIYGAAELQNSQTFFYRVEFNAVEGSQAAGNLNALMWGRRNAEGTSPSFQAAFDLQAVPEPTSIALLAVVGGGLLMRKRYTA